MFRPSLPTRSSFQSQVWQKDEKPGLEGKTFVIHRIICLFPRIIEKWVNMFDFSNIGVYGRMRVHHIAQSNLFFTHQVYTVPSARGGGGGVHPAEPLPSPPLPSPYPSPY